MHFRQVGYASWAVVLFSPFLPILVAGTERLSLSTGVDGNFTVRVDGEVWLIGEEIYYTSGNAIKSTSDGTLSLDHAPVHGNGVDGLGQFTSTSFTWDGGAFITTFREYQNALVFEQSFPRGVLGSFLNSSSPMSQRDGVSTAFPSLSVAGFSRSRGFLGFSGQHLGSEFQYGTGAPTNKSLTGVGGFGPLCIFNQNRSASIVLSSFSQFMAASNALREETLAYGLQGSITEIPAGFSLSYIIVASPSGGVNAAFEAWGDVLLMQYGKNRESAYEDYGLQYLSYSTDNGAYYYYHTAPEETYESTLVGVKEYADTEGIPYRTVLLDSWWYYQGVGGGVTLWEGRPDVFPRGNAYVRNTTGWPIVGHNRYWAIDNEYASTNGGKYNFIVERKADNPEFKDFAWPTEQRFWDDLLRNSSQWGLTMYEQDWLFTEYNSVVHLNTNATAGRTWLVQMASAAERHGITIQYCMSYPRHVLQSVELPAVTNARASVDYHAGHADQWMQLGATGVFAWAVGLAPTKDNFWSTDVQTDSGYDDNKTIREPYTRLQAAVSTLSKGPVAPSDKIGRSDTALILKSCTADGRLLQGDKPAMALDAVHESRAFNGYDGSEVWSTSTNLEGNIFALVFGAKLRTNYTVNLGEDLHLEGPYVIYEANTSSVVTAASTILLKPCGMWDFALWALAPVLSNKWVLLGEMDKWVPVSNARFRNLEVFRTAANETSAAVTALGVEGEDVAVSWLAPGTTTPLVVSCKIGRGGAVKIAVSSDDAQQQPTGSCVDE